MTITSIKDLEKLLKMLRTQGVKSFTIGDMSFELNDIVAQSSPRRSKLRQVEEPSESFPPNSIDESIQIPQMSIETDELTPDQMLFYSVQSESEQ